MTCSREGRLATRWRAAAVATSIVLAGCGGPRAQAPVASSRAHARAASSGAGGDSTASTTRKPAVVLLVVDQLAAWIAEERWPLLPETGGFARLRARGAYVPRALHGHATTDTAPGHSALFTGLPPRDTGVAANERVRDDGTRESFLRDASAHLVNADGPASRPASSLASLRVETVADTLRPAHAHAIIVALSLKDRATLFAAGRAPTAALYFESDRAEFVASSAHGDAFPAFARVHGSADSVRAMLATPWLPLDEGFVRAHARTVDDAPGEGDLGGLGTTFPHDFANVPEASRGKAFRASPRGDEALVTLAIDATHALYRPDAPFLLSVSFSSNDYVGHVFGPDSWEAWDELARLDRELARLLDALDASIGRGAYTVLLSADHGVSPLPEEESRSLDYCRSPAADTYERVCRDAHRVHPDTLAASLEAALDRRLGEGEYVLGIADPWVRLAPSVWSLPEARRDAIVRALVEEARRVPGIDDAVDARSLPTCLEEPPRTRDALVCRSLARGVGEIYLVSSRGTFFDSTYVPGKGGGHGSPWLYDRAVPLVVAPAVGASIDLDSLTREPILDVGAVYHALALRALGL